MKDAVFRPLTEADKGRIIRIWQDSFGDSAGFISDMLRCALPKNAVGAELDGELRSCMFAFDGLRCGKSRASYLYALCTEPSYRGRGLGKSVTEYAAEAAVKRGAEAVFLRPGNAGLERWYSEAMGAMAVVRSAVENFRPQLPPRLIAREISPTDYLALRPRSFWEPGEQLILAQGVVNRHFGGSFLTAGDAIMCVEEGPGGVLVREIFSDSPEEALAAAAEHYSVSKLGVLQSSSEGLPLMALPVGKDIRSCVFSYLPFTLD